MSDKVKILHLEDEINITEMVNRILQSNNIDADVLRVETEKDFKREIKNDSYDLILADYHLPTYDGFSALNASKENKSSSDIPFILFSGNIGEEKAINSLKMGATDYVLKQNINALYPAINRGLEESKERKKRKNIQKELEESYNLLEKISSGILDAIIMMDNNGNISFWNTAAEKMFGYSKNEAIGKYLHQLITPSEYQKMFENKFPDFQKTGKGDAIGKTLELIALKKDGSEIDIELLLSSVKIQYVWHAVGIIRDITERKRNEKIAIEMGKILDKSLNEFYTFSAENYKFIQANQGALNNIRYTLGELQNLCPWDIKTDYTKDSFLELIKPLKEGIKNKIVFNAYHERKDGTRYPTEVHLQLTTLDNNDVYIANIIDISDKLESEKALSLSESKYQSLVDNIDIGISLISKNMEILTLNKKMKEWFPDINTEYKPICYKAFNDPPKKEYCSYCPTIKTLKDGKVHESTSQTEQGGEIINYRIVASPICNDKGEVVAAIEMVEDVTLSTKAEKELKESEEKYRLIVENAYDGIEITQNDKIIFSNSRFNKMLGYSATEVENMPFSQIFTKDATIELKLREQLRKSKGEAPHSYQTKFKKKDGKIIDVDVKYEIINYKGHPATFAIIRDITDLKRTQQNLTVSESKYRTLYESTSDAIMMLDDKGFFDCNPRALKMFGINDKEIFCNCHPSDLSPPKQYDGSESKNSADKFIKIALEKGSHQFEWLHKRHNSSEVFPAEVLLSRMELDGKQVLQATVRDITERKNLEIQLSQAQKLESIGQLAAGIAHEINTPIQFVNDNTHFLNESFKDISEVLLKYKQLLKIYNKNKDAESLIQEISDYETQIDIDYLIEDIPVAIEQTLGGIARVSKIVKAMKDFSHPGQEEKTNININSAIENTITISKNEWKYLADINTEFNNDIPLVNCFPGELNQVFLNIIVNAAHAIQDKIGSEPSKKGIVKISTGYDSNYVVVRISDSGNGIPNEILSKIFDPFFTTKTVGKGTGQGLAISHSVVTQKHDGKLEVETEIGTGSTFIIKIPIEKD